MADTPQWEAVDEIPAASLNSKYAWVNDMLKDVLDNGKVVRVAATPEDLQSLRLAVHSRAGRAGGQVTTRYRDGHLYVGPRNQDGDTDGT